MNRRLAQAVTGLCGLLLAACGVAGSGDLVTDVRDVGTFDSLDISEGLNVELVVDPSADVAVAVTYDDNVVDQIVTRVSGDTLVIEYEDPPRPVRLIGGGRAVAVTVPSIESIELSGGSDLVGSGTDRSYSLTLSGGSNADLRDLEAEEVDIDISGGSDATLFASDTVSGEASGGSDVTVFGDPSSVLVDSSGGSELRIR